jgi:hypothetical protein
MQSRERETDQVDAVARGEREDVGAGEDAGAGGLDLRLDGVDEVESEGGSAGVRSRALLPGRRRRVVQQQRGVASLESTNRTQAKRFGALTSLLRWGSGTARTLTKQSWKKRRSTAAPVRVSFMTACDMTWRTTLSAVGQLAE